MSYERAFQLRVFRFEDNTIAFYDGEKWFAPVADIILDDGSKAQAPVKLMELNVKQNGTQTN